MYIWLRFSRRIPRASCFASSWYGKDRNQLLRELVDVQYGRNDIDFKRGTFRVRGDVVEIFPASLDEHCIRIEFFGDEIDRIREVNALTGEVLAERDHVAIFPASHFVTREEK